jgi:hypothetical protein
MQAPHEPRNGFIDRLEWQISSELRRRQRTGPATWLPSSPLKAAAAIAFLVLVSMAAGGAAVAAAVQAQNNERRDLLVSGYERRLELARLRLAAAQLQLHEIERQIAVGTEQPAKAYEPRLKMAEAEGSLQVIQLQLQEVRLTGREALDEISAPLVSGRDFVSERLRAGLVVPERALEIERQRQRSIRSRVEVGVAPQADLAEADARVAEMETGLAGIQRKLEIRRRFVGGQITAAQAELRVLEGDAEQRLKALEPKIAAARIQVAAWERRFNVGLATQVQIAEARLRLSELEADLAKAQLDLALIRKKISEL